MQILPLGLAVKSNLGQELLPLGRCSLGAGRNCLAWGFLPGRTDGRTEGRTGGKPCTALPGQQEGRPQLSPHAEHEGPTRTPLSFGLLPFPPLPTAPPGRAGEVAAAAGCCPAGDAAAGISAGATGHRCLQEQLVAPGARLGRRGRRVAGLALPWGYETVSGARAPLGCLPALPGGSRGANLPLRLCQCCFSPSRSCNPATSPC